MLVLQVGVAIKNLSVDDILAYEKNGSLTVAGHELGPGELKVIGRPHSTLE